MQVSDLLNRYDGFALLDELLALLAGVLVAITVLVLPPTEGGEGERSPTLLTHLLRGWLLFLYLHGQYGLEG